MLPCTHALVIFRMACLSFSVWLYNAYISGYQADGCLLLGAVLNSPKR
jgi:hypothetical protein